MHRDLPLPPLATPKPQIGGYEVSACRAGVGSQIVGVFYTSQTYIRPITSGRRSVPDWIRLIYGILFQELLKTVLYPII